MNPYSGSPHTQINWVGEQREGPPITINHEDRHQDCPVSAVLAHTPRVSHLPHALSPKNHNHPVLNDIFPAWNTGGGGFVPEEPPPNANWERLRSTFTPSLSMEGYEPDPPGPGSSQPMRPANKSQSHLGQDRRQPMRPTTMSQVYSSAGRDPSQNPPAPRMMHPYNRAPQDPSPNQTPIAAETTDEEPDTSSEQISQSSTRELGLAPPDSNGQQARLRLVQSKLGISEVTFEKCRILYNLRPEDFTAVMGMIVMEALSTTNPAPAPGNAPGTIEPPTKPVKAHTYTRDFKAFLKNQLRTILLDPSIERYGKSTAGERHTTKTPIVMMQRKLDEQTPQFHTQNLPPGYVTGDPHAITSVVKVIRSQLKADKTYFAKLLLGGIRSEPGSNTPPVTPVPSLYSLVANVHRYMNPKYGKQDNQEVHQSLGGSSVAARIAFLRIHLHHQYRQGANEANWEKIDVHLETLRSKSQNYRDALASLLIELDQRLWNGKTTADKTAHLDYGFPTEAVISARAATFSAAPPPDEACSVANNQGN